MCEAKKADSRQPDKPWKTELVVFEDKCGLGALVDTLVLMDYQVHEKIIAMTEEMGNDEWLAYLIGEKANDGFYIDDLRVPKQTVTATSVVVDEPDLSTDIIGTVHSHHNMGSFHSGTDNEFLVGNHELTLVYSNTGEYACKVRLALPCGHYYAKKVTLEIEYPEVPGIEQWIAASKANVEKKSYYTYTPNYGGGYGNSWFSQRTYQYGRFCAKCRSVVPWGSGLWDKQGILYCPKCVPLEKQAEMDNDYIDVYDYC